MWLYLTIGTCHSIWYTLMFFSVTSFLIWSVYASPLPHIPNFLPKPTQYTSLHIYHCPGLCPSLGSESFISDLTYKSRIVTVPEDLPRESLFGVLSQALLAALLWLCMSMGPASWACDYYDYPGLYAQKGHVFGLRLCCCCLEFLNFWTRVSTSSFLTGPTKDLACPALFWVVVRLELYKCHLHYSQILGILDAISESKVIIVFQAAK